MEIAFRPATEHDFEACRRLYFSQMANALREFHIDPATHAKGFREQWNPAQVQILRLNGNDVGWLQIIDRGTELFLGQLFVEPDFQNRGIGTLAIRSVLRRAAVRAVPLALAVVKGNPALRLYVRLGFRITHEDDRKFYLRHDPLADAPAGV